MSKVLFICTGNTCRSPMAEGFYNSIYGGGASSRGLMVCGAEPASEMASSVMREKGIDIGEHLSRQVTAEEISAAERVYTMTQSQKSYLRSALPQFAGKIDTLGEADVPDPYMGSEEEYRACAEQIEKYVRQIGK